MARRDNLTWLWVLIAAAVLTQTALNLLRPVTSYKLLALGAGETAVGLATAAYAVLPLFLAMSMGRWSSRLPSLRKMLVLGAFIIGLGGVGLAMGDRVAVLMGASTALGMGHLVFTIAGQSAISRHAPADMMDAGFGWLTAAYSIGQMAGPLLSGATLGNTSLAQASAGTVDGRIEAALWLGAGISLLAVPVMYVMGSAGDHPSTGRERSAAEAVKTSESASRLSDLAAGKPTMLRILKIPGIPSHILASLALLAVIDILTAFMPLVGEAAGISPLWVGILLAVRGGGSVLSRIFLPWFTARWSRNTLVLAALLLSAAAIGLVPLALEPIGALWLAVALMLVGGMVLGLGQPLTMSLISQSVPVSWGGSALALRLVGNRLGQAVLPAVAGVAAAPLGPAAGIWFVCAVLAASGAERIFSGRVGPDPGGS